MKKLKEILLSVLVAIFAMAAGAACYHQYVQAMDTPEKIAAVAPVQQETGPSEEIKQMEVGLEEKELEEKSEAFYDSLELLAICVEAEAGNQPIDGKRMVVDVILNRVDDPEFPDTIEGVISQKYHFASFWDGGMDRVSDPSEETILAVQMELKQRSWPGLFYFTAEDYSEYGTPWKKVGDHYFSTK